MANQGVKCNVGDCVHNLNCCGCNLPVIDVTCETCCQKATDSPHFCKSYQKK